eukprot:CAMPEP_0196579060 /NCGR_PEP_ID=MMETSP1081-20130531/17036_1 /TAXON_ID=36882 /ORGANISM="Pyramimonas amylifera, Strain CCMP720" /LENGTH=136 /DNA_ID=CAMNT_0041898505 /DNA_START=296 /DNA_END=706 /DNA_ORIENTATION=+
MIPRPGSEVVGSETVKPELKYAKILHSKYPHWKSNTCVTTGGEYLQRRVEVGNSKEGRDLLQQAQLEFHEVNSKGCQLRRETQSTFSLCCEQVRAVFYEPRSEVVFEVPLPGNDEESNDVESLLERVELLTAISKS